MDAERQQTTGRIAWKECDGDWTGNLDGSWRDYGEGHGGELDSFTVTLRSDRARWLCEIEHNTRGGGAEQHVLAGLLPDAQQQAERLLLEFIEAWETVDDEQS